MSDDKRIVLTATLIALVFLYAPISIGAQGSDSATTYRDAFLFSSVAERSRLTAGSSSTLDAWGKKSDSFVPSGSAYQQKARTGEGECWTYRYCGEHSRLVGEYIGHVERCDLRPAAEKADWRQNYDSWMKEATNRIFSKSAEEWKNGKLPGGVDYRARYSGPGLSLFKQAQAVENASGSLFLRIETGLETFETEPFEPVVFKAACELAAADNRATITLDPVPGLDGSGNVSFAEQRFISTGVNISSSAAFIMAEADLLLKSVDFGYDVAKDIDRFDTFRGLLGTGYYDRVFSEPELPGVWKRMMIVVDVCPVSLSAGKVIFQDPLVKIDIGAQRFLNGSFVEDEGYVLSGTERTNKNTLETRFHYLAGRPEFGPWGRLVKTAQLSVLMEKIKNTEEKAFAALAERATRIPRNPYPVSLPMKQSFNLVRAESETPAYIPYSDGKQVSGKRGGVSFSPRSSVRFNNDDLFLMIYDYIEIMTKERLYGTRLSSIFYDKASGLPVFWIDEAGNRVILAYDEKGLKAIGLSHSGYKSRYLLEFIDQEGGSRNSETYSLGFYRHG